MCKVFVWMLYANYKSMSMFAIMISPGFNLTLNVYLLFLFVVSHRDQYLQQLCFSNVPLVIDCALNCVLVGLSLLCTFRSTSFFIFLSWKWICIPPPENHLFYCFERFAFEPPLKLRQELQSSHTCQVSWMSKCVFKQCRTRELEINIDLCSEGDGHRCFCSGVLLAEPS